MANFILTWNPLWPATSQKLYYRKKGDTVWLNLATVNPKVDTYKAVNLDDNTVYEFQVEDVIISGNILSNIDDGIEMICVPLTLTVSGNTVNYSFSPEGEDIDHYIVELFKNGKSVLKQTFNPPYASTVTGSFTSLTATDTYQIRLNVVSSVGGTKSCTLMNVGQISCTKATGITGTIV